MSLQRVRHFVTKGPHGNAVMLICLMAVGVFAALTLGMIYRPGWEVAVAIALAANAATVALIAMIVSRLRAKVNDVHYAVSLEAGLQRSGWLLADFFTDEAAANPSLQLLNLKVLQLCRPRRILELGSGQTTKILSAYTRATPTSSSVTLEQDAGWVERLAPYVSHDYRYAPLEGKAFSCAGSGLHIKTQWYAGQPDLRSQQFDYILVDGPDSGTRNSAHVDYDRAGILEYIPSILAPSFVLVFDDAERSGEQMTIRALKEILDRCKVPYVSFSVHGVKTQTVFCSADRSFLQSV